MGVEPLVERDGEGEELLLAVEGVDHLEVELCMAEGWVVEFADVVEEVPGEGGVGIDGGGLEAEIGVVLDDFLVDGRVVNGDGGEPGTLVPKAERVEKRRRLMSSRVAAGMTSWLTEMNWMRTSSRERARSESLEMMTRTGTNPCWT